MSQPWAAAHPDRSVRVAWVADAAALGRVQARTWRATCAGLVPQPLLDAMDPEALAGTWAAALRRPPSARHRVLVALDRVTVVGFAALGPSEDPDADPVADADLALLLVDPDHHRQGHGSRLLSAVVDTARADGFVRLSTWVLARDDGLRSLLESAGWAPDGAHREVAPVEDGAEVEDEVEDEKDTVRQVRLHTSLEDG